MSFLSTKEKIKELSFDNPIITVADGGDFFFIFSRKMLYDLTLLRSFLMYSELQPDFIKKMDNENKFSFTHEYTNDIIRLKFGNIFSFDQMKYRSTPSDFHLNIIFSESQNEIHNYEKPEYISMSDDIVMCKFNYSRNGWNRVI